jgi:hypothetical protein
MQYHCQPSSVHLQVSGVPLSVHLVVLLPLLIAVARQGSSTGGSESAVCMNACARCADKACLRDMSMQHLTPCMQRLLPLFVSHKTTTPPLPRVPLPFSTCSSCTTLCATPV